MKFLLSLFISMFALSAQAVEFYKYKACQLEKPQQIQLDPGYPGLNEPKSQLSMNSVYNVSLMGDTDPASQERPYVLIKDAAAKMHAVRLDWLTAKSEKKIFALKCKPSNQATQEFQNVMNAIDEKEALDGVGFKIEDCIPTGGSGVYQVCVPLVIMDYNHVKTGGFSTIKCIFSATTSAAEKNAHVTAGPPASAALVHYRMMPSASYDPKAPVYQAAYSSESQKFKDVAKDRPFACQNVDVGTLHEANPTATSATVR